MSSSEASIEPHEYNEHIAFQKLLDEELQAISDHELALSLAGVSITDADRASRAEYKAQLAAASTCRNDTQSEMPNQHHEPGSKVAGTLHALVAQLRASASRDNGIQRASSEIDTASLETDTASLYLTATETVSDSDGDDESDSDGDDESDSDGDDESDSDDTASPETDSAQTQTAAAEQTHSVNLSSKDVIKCNACMEVTGIEESLQLQCEHTYCHACLLTLFTSAMSDTTLFPPRCCRFLIPLDICRMVLPKELIKEYDLKVEELATPNPTYCANVDCSKHIRPGRIVNGVARCVFCNENTCVLCKSKSHKGLCPSDPHVQLLMDLAKRSKWQRCTKCNNMVELDRGCLHMM